MGAYLSKPNTERDIEEGQGNRLEYGAGSMQGWRVSQEDAHNCVTDLDDKSSLFAVYDGHGGPEVAIYLARRFPDFLKKTEAYKSGNWERALHEAYVNIDSHMKTGEAIIEIQKIAKREAGDDSADNIADYEEEDVSELCEEATMPIHDLLQKITGLAAGRANGALASSAEADSADEKPGSSKSLRMELGGEGSSSSATSSSFAYASGSNDRTEEPGTCDSANDVPNSSAKVSASGENTLDADDGECSSSSRVDSVKSEGAVANTAEAEAGGSNSVSSQSSTKSVPKPKSDKDVEPSSSTNEADREVNLIATSSTIPKVNGTKDHGDSQEPDSTEADSSSGKGSSDPETTSSMKPNGEADSTQNDITPETPRRKGKTHPPPVTTPPPSAQRRSQRKQVNDAQVYENFLNDASDSGSDDDAAPGPAFDHDASSDEEEGGNSSSSEEDSDVNLEGEEEEEDDDDDEMSEDVSGHHLLHDVQEPGYDSGSTAVVAFFRWDADKLHLYVANAGDSRCVVSRNGVAIDMSHDHKPEDETEARRIVRAGGKVTQDGRVNGGLNLSRALGDHSYKQNDSLPAEDQMITPVPDIRHEVLDPDSDQFVVLACDGVWNSMCSQEVVDFVIAKMKEGHKISEICGEIFDYCLAPDTSGDGTGCDNMTAIIVKLPTPPTVNSVSAGETSEAGKRRLSSPEEEEEESKRLKSDFE